MKVRSRNRSSQTTMASSSSRDNLNSNLNSTSNSTSNSINININNSNHNSMCSMINNRHRNHSSYSLSLLSNSKNTVSTVSTNFSQSIRSTGSSVTHGHSQNHAHAPMSPPSALNPQSHSCSRSHSRTRTHSRHERYERSSTVHKMSSSHNRNCTNVHGRGLSRAAAAAVAAASSPLPAINASASIAIATPSSSGPASSIPYSVTTIQQQNSHTHPYSHSNHRHGDQQQQQNSHHHHHHPNQNFKLQKTNLLIPNLKPSLAEKDEYDYDSDATTTATTATATHPNHHNDNEYVHLHLPLPIHSKSTSNSNSTLETNEMARINQCLLQNKILSQRADDILSHRVKTFTTPTPYNSDSNSDGSNNSYLSACGYASASDSVSASFDNIENSTSNDYYPTYPFRCSFSSNGSDDYYYGDDNDDNDDNDDAGSDSSSVFIDQQAKEKTHAHDEHKDADTHHEHKTYKQKPVIYAHQREVVHASSTQYDDQGAILVTDGATTCHVLALRSYRNNSVTCTGASTSNNTSNTKILGSLCHLDSTSYTSCLDKMFNKHFQFHGINDNDNAENKITMEIHLVGGYNDSKNTSVEITCHLIQFLNKLSNQYQSSMNCILQTCVISSLNDITTYTTSNNDLIDEMLNMSNHSYSNNHNINTNNTTTTTPTNNNNHSFGRTRHNSSASSLSSFDTNASNSTTNTTWSCHEYYTPPSPIVRGMALDVKTGHVQLLNTVDPSLWGPESTLRRVRLWGGADGVNDEDLSDEDFTSGNATNNKSNDKNTSTPSTSTSSNHDFNSLLEVHSYEQEQIIIPPFEFKPFDNIELFCKLSDDVMLSLASTSPDVEDEDFCMAVRESCQFLMTVSVESVFGVNSSSCTDTVNPGRKALVYDFDGDGWWDRVF